MVVQLNYVTVINTTKLLNIIKMDIFVLCILSQIKAKIISK